MSTNSIKVYNTSTLSGSHFEFSIAGYPNLLFTVQTCNLPAVQNNPKAIPTPFGDTHVSGDKVEYQTLDISFIVDETLNNWREIYAWIRALAPTNAIEEGLINNQYVSYDKPLYSVGNLYILTNSLHINLTATFNNLFPISLSNLDFSVKDTEDRKLFATVSFAYDYFDLQVNPIYNPNGYVPDNVIN